MKIFVAGATGVLGLRLLPLLLDAGHEVTGMTRSAGKAAPLANLGVTPVVCDVFDIDALCQAMSASRPAIVIHQLTDLPDDPARIAEFAAGHVRIHTEGTHNLLAAAGQAGAKRVIAQSVAWQLPPGNGAAAVEDLERAVLAVGGVVLRYGQWYGPGTYYQDQPPPPPRIHIERAAAGTVAALDAPSGVLTLVDDSVPQA